jgi:ribosomal protein S18 acetylase RimI-like enzyme
MQPYWNFSADCLNERHEVEPFSINWIGRKMSTPSSFPIIRPATIEDSGTLSNLHVKTWQTAYSGIVPASVLNGMDVARRTEQFRRAITTQQEETYVLLLNAEMVGFLTLGAARDPDLDASTMGEIWGIYILPDHWHRGFGSRLVQYAESVLGDRHYQQIVLWVLAANQSARSFYESWGFSPDGMTKTIPWHPPTTAIRYRKRLSEWL